MAQRPEGVTIIHPSGQTVSVELAYEGIRDGIHVWRSITPVTRGDRVHITVLPGHTTIVFGEEVEES